MIFNREKIWESLKQLTWDFSRILFPVCCPVCHKPLVKGEKLLCLECMWKIPRTDYHSQSENDLIKKLVDPKVPIEKAVAFFFYKNSSPYSSMIRDAKYNSRPEINRQLARHYALEIRSSGFFDDIDLIMPVPIHWTKRLRRGYNQTEYITAGLSEVTGIPVANNLRAAKRHSTQTHKSGVQRVAALRDVFVVEKAEELAGRHLLLVDDVITTGSTIMACAKALLDSTAGLRLSILSLAATKLEK